MGFYMLCVEIFLYMYDVIRVKMMWVGKCL